MNRYIVIVMLLIITGACNQQTKTEEEPTSSGVIEIENGWVRPGNAGMMTAAYFTINNGTGAADTLLSIQSNVTNDTQIHESYEMEGGLMGMREIGQVLIDAGSYAELKPGGIHIMIIRPENDVAAGDSVEFLLNFSAHGEMKVALPVRSN